MWLVKECLQKCEKRQSTRYDIETDVEYVEDHEDIFEDLKCAGYV